MAAKITLCKTCGKEISSKAKTCPHCGGKNKTAIYKKPWFWIIVFIFLIGLIGASSSADTGTEPTESANSSHTTEKGVTTTEKANVFSGDCGISAIAEMGTDIIGQPTVSVSVTNTSDKKIQAIQFYAIPYDVYGEELKGVFTQNRLSIDNSIASGESDTTTYQLLDNQVKTVKLYVYSVYFEDGTEWGNREATKTMIKENAKEIAVDGARGE